MTKLYEEIYKLKNLQRSGWLMRNAHDSKTNRVESDAEHTFSMSMLALEIISKEKLANAAKNNDLGVFGNIAAPKIQHYANNPQELERFLSDPKNQTIIKKLIGGG